MDDLISRKAAIDALGECPENWTDSPEEIEAVNSWRFAVNAIKSVPSVLAVPLDKLCALLAKNADCPPEHSPVQDHCKENCAECWEAVLKEWMDEQDAAGQ